MSTYKYFGEHCAICHDWFPKREMTKLYTGESHHSCPTPKKLCCVCEYCFPKLLDFLEVPEPEEPERKPYKPRQLCHKCFNYAGKTAKFCPYCGDELATQNKEN